MSYNSYNLEIQPEQPVPVQPDINFLNIKQNFKVNDVEAQNKIGSKINVKTIAAGDLAAYSVLLTDFVIAVGSVGTAKTITLPKPSVAGLGKVFVIKDASGSALTTTITIAPNGTELINGDTTLLINTNFGVVGVYTDGTNWFSI